jgi:hypothetical protein
MDEIIVKINLVFSANVTDAEITMIYDRLAELLESKADELFQSDDGELVDYAIEIERGE